MAEFKKIYAVVKGAEAHMVGDGFKVSNYFPGQNKFGRRISPFFLLDYNAPTELPPTTSRRGVGAHPHRGFETVTIAFEGAIAHHDSAGNSGVIEPGGVQWMTAGSGVLHSEYHDKNFASSGGTFHMIQLWVNLPSKYKMTTPGYQEISKEIMGKYFFDDGQSSATIIAGDFKGIKGPAKSFTPIHLLIIELFDETGFDIELPEAYNTGILILEGNVQVNEERVAKAKDFVLFDNRGERILILSTAKKAKFVLMSGEPLNEPIAQYGPFLMNTQEEIRQAIADYNDGKFGELNG